MFDNKNVYFVKHIMSLASWLLEVMLFDECSLWNDAVCTVTPPPSTQHNEAEACIAAKEEVFRVVWGRMLALPRGEWSTCVSRE